MTRPVEWTSEAAPLLSTTRVGGTTVGAGSGAAGEVPIANGDDTATWALLPAEDVTYDPTASGLTATDVQAAIDELETEIEALPPPSAIEALDEGTSLTATLASLDFVGAGVTASATGDAVTVTIPGGSSVNALDDLSDVTITSPAEDDTLQYIGGDWVNTTRRWEPVTFDPGGGPEIVFTSTDIVMTWMVS